RERHGGARCGSGLVGAAMAAMLLRGKPSRPWPLPQAIVAISGKKGRRRANCFEIRNNAQSAGAGGDRRLRSFSNVEATFRLRRRPQFSKFETNQVLVDKA